MDLDGDGKKDIISGSWPGQIYFFKRLSKTEFAERKKLCDEKGKDLVLGSASTVFACDWDADDNADLLIGDIDGNVHLVKNLVLQDGAVTDTRDAVQSNKSPEISKTIEARWSGIEKLTGTDGKPVKAKFGDSHPIACDWDKDGKLDLLLGGGDGSVLFYPNKGTKKSPLLAAGQVLVDAGQMMRSENNETHGRGSRAKLCVVDWNKDGIEDLLVGEVAIETLPPKSEGQRKSYKYHGRVWLFQGTREK